MVFRAGFILAAHRPYARVPGEARVPMNSQPTLSVTSSHAHGEKLAAYLATMCKCLFGARRRQTNGAFGPQSSHSRFLEGDHLRAVGLQTYLLKVLRLPVTICLAL